MKAIVTGMIGAYPVGGVAYDYGHYLVGLQQLGFEVLYLEDTGIDCYDPDLGDVSSDPAYALRFIEQALVQLSPDTQILWCFRQLDGSCFGLAREQLLSFIEQADLFLNVSNSALLREEYLGCRRKLMLDTDPGLTQMFRMVKGHAAGNYTGFAGVREHDYFYTYAENIHGEDCSLPKHDLPWITTRPVVVPGLWDSDTLPGTSWTTVLSWNSYGKPMEYEGRLYGGKELEFHHIEHLPGKIDRSAVIASGGLNPPWDLWHRQGWQTEDAPRISRTLETYRQFILDSYGELSIAKNIYVATRSGWFSCRSICYMMAGRPVVLQDTGFSRYIPTGEGVLAFEDEASALTGVQEVERDYPRHAEAARRIAMDYFSPEPVLGEMLRQVGLHRPDLIGKGA